MQYMNKQNTAKQTVISGRENEISGVLFRNIAGAALGLNITDMECLDLLFFRKVATPTELARYTGISSGAATAMLDRLENLGIIERKPNPHDRRGVLVVVAQGAAEKFGQLFGSVRQAQRALLSDYSEQDLALLTDYFKKSAQMWEAERLKLEKKLRQNLL